MSDFDDATGDLDDDDKRACLRAVAEEIRGDSNESEQVAAMLYRVSDVYDEDEETTPRDVYVNMRNILRVKERGGRDPEPEGL
jgi:hypothetical protein